MEWNEADILKQHLVLTGIVSKPADGQEWPCFVDLQPVAGDFVVTLYNTHGYMDGRIMGAPAVKNLSPKGLGGETISHPGIQIRVRAADMLDVKQEESIPAPRVAMDKIKLIAIALDKINNVQITMDDDQIFRITSFWRTSDIVSLGEEDQKLRVSYAFNGILTVAKVISGITY